MDATAVQYIKLIKRSIYIGFFLFAKKIRNKRSITDMKILELVEKYNSYNNSTLKASLLKDIKITPYVSIIKKDT